MARELSSPVLPAICPLRILAAVTVVTPIPLGLIEQVVGVISDFEHLKTKGEEALCFLGTTDELSSAFQFPIVSRFQRYD